MFFPQLVIDILLDAGEHMQAVDVMGENGMHQRLIDKARNTSEVCFEVGHNSSCASLTYLPPPLPLLQSETALLSRIGHWLTKLDQTQAAAEVLSKTNDTKGLIDLYISRNRWDEAFALANRNPEYKADIFLPYANWLAENDRFEEVCFREGVLFWKVLLQIDAHPPSPNLPIIGPAGIPRCRHGRARHPGAGGADRKRRAREPL